MNNSPVITPEEWDRIRKHIAEGPAHVHLDENGVVFFEGGMMHPRAYLQIVEEEEPFEDEPVDILKHVSNATASDALIGEMPGSLHGANVRRWEPPKDEEN